MPLVRPDDVLDRRRFLGAAAVGAAGVALAACSSSPSSSSSTGSFPLGAASRARNKPVPITMWHSAVQKNLTTLQTLTRQFNASQHDVSVTLVNQNSYADTLTAYTSALGTKNLPELAMMESIDLQTLIDSKSITPVGNAVAADHSFDLSSILPDSVEYFEVQGVLQAMPWSQSSQVLYYNQNAFEQAGLDPSSPPLTLDAYRSACEAVVSKGVAKYGTSLKLDSSNFEVWTAQAGGDFVNHGNGRTARATEVAFGDATGKMLFTWFSDMLQSKLAQATPGGNTESAFDNLFAIASNTAPMSIDTSAALGTILSVLHLYPKVKLGVGPLPAPPGPGGVIFGGAGLYIVEYQKTDAQQDAAWQFIKYLLGAPQMATWSVGSGYIPIVKAAVNLPLVTSAWASVPQYKVAYEEVVQTRSSVATAGGVVGPYSQIEAALNNGLTAMSEGTSADSALATAVSASNSAISDYNSRLP